MSHFNDVSLPKLPGMTYEFPQLVRVLQVISVGGTTSQPVDRSTGSSLSAGASRLVATFAPSCLPPPQNARSRPQTLVYKNGFAFPREDVNVMMGNATLADLGAGVNILGQKTSIGNLSGPGLLATGGAGNSSQTFAEAAIADGGSATTNALNMSSAPDWVAFDRQVRPVSDLFPCTRHELDRFSRAEQPSRAGPPLLRILP